MPVMHAAGTQQLCAWQRVWYVQAGTQDERTCCRDAKQNPQWNKTCLGREPDSLRFPTGPGSRHSSAVYEDTDAALPPQENHHRQKPTAQGWDLDLSPASAARHRGTQDNINKQEQFPYSSLQSAVPVWHKVTAAFWWQRAINICSNSFHSEQVTFLPELCSAQVSQ